MLLIFNVCVGYGETGSPPKDENEVEVDMLSEAIHAIAMKKDDVPFIVFSETKDMYDEFGGLLENGQDATIERLGYMQKHEFIEKVWQYIYIGICG